MPTDFEDIQHKLSLIHQSSDSLLFTQFQDWLCHLYEETKERVVRGQPGEREMLVGVALAYRRLLDDLNNPIQH